MPIHTSGPILAIYWYVSRDVFQHKDVHFAGHGYVLGVCTDNVPICGVKSSQSLHFGAGIGILKHDLHNIKSCILSKLFNSFMSTKFCTVGGPNVYDKSRQCAIPFSKSPPQSHVGRACHYLHIGECTLPLRVLAVACTMHNKSLQNVTGALRSSYRTLQNRYRKYQFCPSLIEF